MRRLSLLLLLLSVSCASALQPRRIDAVDEAIERAIAEHRIPGGVLLVEHRGQRDLKAYGSRALVPAREAMTADTIFDLASITKSVATAPSIWLLAGEGRVDIDAPVRTYLPEFGDDAVTVRHLLTHTSGLRPGISTQGLTSYGEGIRRALTERPQNRPGIVFRYSDVNYILLGEIVRRVSGQPLDVYASEHVFAPLGMRDTRFRPELSARIAPTEDGLRGVVHDPTARGMGGVAGHAGLFSTAEDLAKFAHAVLRAKEKDDALSHALANMTRVLTPPAVAIHRTGGFDVDSHYSRPRGDLFPEGSFGHTGWTGGFFWIDPSTDTFYVFLSNRVHPDGKGSVVALQRELGTRIAQSLRDGRLQPVPRRVSLVTGGGDAQNGIDVLAASGYEALRGMRIGVIANQTSIDRIGNPTIDLLRSAPGVTVAAIFSPEHGLRGVADEKVGDASYEGIPVYSLYGERRKPSPEQLASLHALVFDIQDIGARFYTYISTMGMAMEAASEAKKKFIVLDRVNPIGGDTVEGPMLEGETNFTAWHRLPVRHGMTTGELARMFRDERGLDLDLTVVAVKRWERAQWQDETGLPWVNTSPNIRSLEAAGLYPGLGLLERALSVGRGTDTPFTIVGAPYIDGAALARELHVPGVSVTPIRFTPSASTHAGVECGGIRIAITDRTSLRSVDLGIAIASALSRLYPDQFPVDEMQPLLRHPATIDAIRAGKSVEEIRALWAEDLREFELRRAKYVR